MYRFTLRGEILPELTSEFIESQLQKAGGDDIHIDVDSIGGCLNTGLSVFAELRRYANENNASITTRSSGYVASSATVIFLAGDIRIVNEFMQPFIHEPRYFWSNAETADDFRKDAMELEKSKNQVAEFYAKNTDMTKEQALDLMANDTWLTADECLALGFATEIEQLSRKQAKLVAQLQMKVNQKKSVINSNSNIKMANKNKSWVSRFLKMQQSTKMELKLNDVAGTEITFPDLNEDDTPAEGNKVIVGEDANYTGEIQTDEYILAIEDGTVTEVIDKDELDEEAIIEELLDLIEEKDAQLANMKLEVDKYKKIHNALGSKNQPNGNRKGKSEAPAEEKSKAEMAFERIKNRKNK